MLTKTMKEFQRNVADTLSEVREGQKPCLLTRNGKKYVAVVPLSLLGGSNSHGENSTGAAEEVGPHPVSDRVDRRRHAGHGGEGRGRKSNTKKKAG